MGEREGGEPVSVLADVIADFAFAGRDERIALLLEYADRFEEVPERVQRRPFPESHHVPRCESEAYVWAEDLEGGGLKFHFAVENPQGISARAWSVILDETLSGRPLEEVAGIPADAVFDVFGRDISMGKGQGLMGITDMVTAFARQRLKQRAASANGGHRLE
ncbi:MAG: SufE family protein [Dehalococcoidia bacterium]